MTDAPIPAPVSWRAAELTELQERAERLVEEQPRHGLASLREVLWGEFKELSDDDINLAALRALGEWR